VITDPHVREDYLTYADHPHLTYCVFDAGTKQELLEKATRLGKYVNPKQVIVSGPPVDPRVAAVSKHKKPWDSATEKHRPLRLCLTTGGLGTNKAEIEQILTSLLPVLSQNNSPIQLMIYAGTQWDIKEMVENLAGEKAVHCTTLTEADPAHFKVHASLKPAGTHPEAALLKTNLSVIYHPQIVDANELLIRYGFPWADGFITKPSGDMAYDAAAAGCFLLTLAEWGEWEHNIREIFTRAGIATRADLKDFAAQLKELTAQGWITTAMQAAQDLGPEFTNGAQGIIEAYRQVASRK
jgi:hypothetical protein